MSDVIKCDQCHKTEYKPALTLYARAGEQFNKYFCTIECRDAWDYEHRNDPPPVNELLAEVDRIIAEWEGKAERLKNPIQPSPK